MSGGRALARRAAAGAAPVSLLQLATMTSELAAEPAQPGPFWSWPVAGWGGGRHRAGVRPAGAAGGGPAAVRPVR